MDTPGRPAPIPFDDRRWDGVFKVEILEFNSDLNAEGIIDWLSAVERVFDLKNVTIYDTDFDDEDLVEVSFLSYRSRN